MPSTFRIDALEAEDHGLVSLRGTTAQGAYCSKEVAVAPVLWVSLKEPEPQAAEILADAIEPVVAHAAHLPLRASFACRSLGATAYTVEFDPPGQFQHLRLRFEGDMDGDEDAFGSSARWHARAVSAALRDPRSAEASCRWTRPFDASSIPPFSNKRGDDFLGDHVHEFTRQTGLRVGDWCTLDASTGREIKLSDFGARCEPPCEAAPAHAKMVYEASFYAPLLKKAAEYAGYWSPIHEKYGTFDWTLSESEKGLATRNIAIEGRVPGGWVIDHYEGCVASFDVITKEKFEGVRLLLTDRHKVYLQRCSLPVVDVTHLYR